MEGTTSANASNNAVSAPARFRKMTAMTPSSLSRVPNRVAHLPQPRTLPANPLGCLALLAQVDPRPQGLYDFTEEDLESRGPTGNFRITLGKDATRPAPRCRGD